MSTLNRIDKESRSPKSRDSLPVFDSPAGGRFDIGSSPHSGVIILGEDFPAKTAMAPAMVMTSTSVGQTENHGSRVGVSRHWI